MANIVVCPLKAWVCVYSSNIAFKWLSIWNFSPSEVTVEDLGLWSCCCLYSRGGNILWYRTCLFANAMTHLHSCRIVIDCCLTSCSHLLQAVMIHREITIRSSLSFFARSLWFYGFILLKCNMFTCCESPTNVSMHKTVVSEFMTSSGVVQSSVNFTIFSVNCAWLTAASSVPGSFLTSFSIHLFQ